jgi:hypothetical protein
MFLCESNDAILFEDGDARHPFPNEAVAFFIDMPHTGTPRRPIRKLSQPER